MPASPQIAASANLELTGGSCDCKIQVATTHVKLQLEADNQPHIPAWNELEPMALKFDLTAILYNIAIAVGYLST
jgi:hypothetical protein